LAERRRRLAQWEIVAPAGVTRFEIPIDLRTMALTPRLESHVDGKSPVFIAWEGMSMYFEEEEVRGILRGMAPLLAHRDSRLWVDLVDRRAVDHPEAFPSEVQAFMRGMQVLGEPFTFGADDAGAFMADNGLACRELAPSNVFLDGREDPVYAVYKFCLASGAASPPPAADRKLRTDAASPPSPGARKASVPNALNSSAGS
jgi:O-methyltransferase involved in polyketide biosynthesis